MGVCKYDWAALDGTIKRRYPNCRDTAALADALGITRRHLHDRAHKLGVKRQRTKKQRSRDAGRRTKLKRGEMADHPLGCHLLETQDEAGYRPSGLPSPTTCPPGSPGKIEALAERFMKGQVLHHPEDAGVLCRLTAEGSRMYQDSRKESEQ